VFDRTQQDKSADQKEQQEDRLYERQRSPEVEAKFKNAGRVCGEGLRIEVPQNRGGKESELQ
jgi:hypothetical protein